MGQGSQPSFHTRLSAICVPTLLLAGEEDAKFRALAQEMATAIPNARFATIPNAGHAAHFEQPAIFDDIVLTFLRQHLVGAFN
ncbi:MAG: alpha/beta fold hydrolase [Thermomicrobiales bacterium]